LLATGGAFDVDPALLGDNYRHETVNTKAGLFNALYMSLYLAR